MVKEFWGRGTEFSIKCSEGDGKTGRNLEFWDGIAVKPSDSTGQNNFLFLGKLTFLFNAKRITLVKVRE